ncbi:LCP family protein [Kitasatospora sp. CB01950]|uniref:LCP family protein n=1 Tax=Kitasatospora sp. CB01950 TaxID=1703930 RepID=UPI00093CDCD2|nr:LCP family protein [Kitasatospora sp. CB01950]OKJ00025.1 transcriptional regulator [Kitasatospora sp. CB01950]
MAGQRAGASDANAGWWENEPPQSDAHRQDPPPAGVPRRRAGSHDDQAAGGRAGGRRAQGRGSAATPPRSGRRAASASAAEPETESSGGSGAGSGGRGGSRRAAAQGRRKPRKAKKIIIWSLVGASVAVVGTGGYVYWRLNGNISAFDGEGISKDRPEAAAADSEGRRPMNILLIGSDSRDGANKDLGGGDEGGARSDTTILLHVYADHKHAVGVSFPRDAMVSIPRCMLPNKSWTKPQTSAMFNGAFSVGGTEQGNPACTQNTVEALTGLRVDHTMVVNFEGFAAMTKAVGGVEVCLPNPIHDYDLNPKLPKTGGKEIYPKGVQKVEGQAALDYVRLRHGIGDGSDVGRMKRQQAFLSQLMKTVKTKGMSPTNLLPLADAATKSLTVDPGLAGVDKLLDLGTSLKDIDLHDIKFITTPWHYDGNRIGLNHPEVDQLWAALKADRTLDGTDASGGQSPAPSESAAPSSSAPATPVNGTGIKVGVFNGSGAAGLGNKAAGALKAANFTVTATGNASSQNHATTVVQYGSGQKANAEAVASLFPGATVEAGSTAGISLILGKDYAASAGNGQGGTTPDPGPLSSAVSNDARSADEDPCSNVSYG